MLRHFQKKKNPKILHINAKKLKTRHFLITATNVTVTTTNEIPFNEHNECHLHLRNKQRA